MWIKFKTNMPPHDKDILILLADKVCVVGRKNGDGKLFPVNIHPRDNESILEFDSDPIAWKELPWIEGAKENYT